MCIFVVFLYILPLHREKAIKPVIKREKAYRRILLLSSVLLK